MISAVDLLKGIAIGSGMNSIDVEGANGTLTTNFDGKAQAAINALENGEDFVLYISKPPTNAVIKGTRKAR